jgi:uridine phosphorylase
MAVTFEVPSRSRRNEPDALRASHHFWTSNKLLAATKGRLQISSGQVVSTDKWWESYLRAENAHPVSISSGKYNSPELSPKLA